MLADGRVGKVTNLADSDRIVETQAAARRIAAGRAMAQSTN
jgi:hypothetical protein